MISGKIFTIREKTVLADIATRLKDFRVEEPFEHEGTRLSLLTEIRDLKLLEGRLTGNLLRDTVIFVNQRQKLVPTLRTREAFFSFHEHDAGILLTVLEKKYRANYAANVLSKLLFVTVGKILEVRIPPENLKKFNDENTEDTKVVYFDDVDVPNVSKLALYGSLLKETPLFDEYLQHGLLWYTVVRSNKFGYVVGVTRTGIVVVFNRVGPDEYLDYVAKEIFPLISP